jgi:hypothetical protein
LVPGIGYSAFNIPYRQIDRQAERTENLLYLRESVTAYQHVIERLKLRALGFLVVDPDPIRLQVGIVTVEERRPSCRRRLGIRRGLRMELRVREQLDASCGKNE